MTPRRPLPEGEGPGSYDETRVPLVPEGYSVFSHSPDPVPGRSPADAVLLVFHVKIGDVSTDIRTHFKSRAALDELIDCLERHAVDVWPKTKPTDGGA